MSSLLFSCCRYILFVIIFISVDKNGFSQSETFPSGSFIINMGVMPQTVNNSLRPYGLVWDLIKNNKIQVKWVISQSKTKDGIDFTYNSVDYSGGTFIIPQKFIDAAVLAKINAFFPSVIAGAYTTSNLTVDVTHTLKYTPRWTFDFDNGSIAQGYLTRAGIPITGFPKKTPAQLNGCDDLFVMPHADPVWSTHKNLYYWNLSAKGSIWAACHAVSAMENIYNPANPSEQLNFLSNRFSGFGIGHNPGSTWAANSLVLWGDHNDPNTSFPFALEYPNDPEMQFMGSINGGIAANGSERGYMPYNTTTGGAGNSTTWRATTKVAAYDSTAPAINPNIPEKTDGPVAVVAYGRAFGDPYRGQVMYESGHSHDGTSAEFVAAQRIFFNFSFMSTIDKDPLPIPSGPSNITSGSVNTYSVTLGKPTYNLNDFYVEWSASCPGTFTNKYSTTTSFTPSGVASCGPCIIKVTVYDNCGRVFYEELPVTVCPAPPVALDRTTNLINNLPGTGPQPIAEVTPLAGTDPDGVVVSYTVTMLPVAAQGELFYDHDGNTGTPDIAVPANVALTPAQMATIKFDPADGFGGNATFNYTVTDNTNLSDLTPATYTIPVNPPPAAQDILTIPINSNAGPTTISPGLIATDNGTVVSYTISTLPDAAHGILFLNGVPVTIGQIVTPVQAAQLSFDPSGSYVGYANFTFTATDNDGATDPTPATVTIQIVNQPPVALDISAPYLDNPNGTGQTAIPALSATDSDGTVVSYTLTSVPPVTEGVLYYHNGTSYVPAFGTLVLTPAQAASLRFDPTDGFTGNSTFTYSATDNFGLVDNTPATYNIPVGIVPPIATDITNPAIYSGAGQTPINALAGTDPDATDVITSYTITTLPPAALGELYYNDGTGFVPVPSGAVLTPAQMATLRFDPADSATGNALFTYTVTDDEALTDQSPATFTIPLTNTPPVANNVINPALNSSDGPVGISPLSASDADGTVVSYTITSLPVPAKGILLLSGTPVLLGQVLTPAQISMLQFDPAPGSSGNAVFNFTATDDQGATDATPATFTIPITQVLEPPVADDKTNTAIAVSAGATSLLPLSATDPDGTIVSYTIISLPPAGQGTLFLNGVAVTAGQVIPAYLANELKFDPSGTYAGNVVFNYTATDNDGLTDATPAVFTIPVVNQPPVAHDVTVPSIKKGNTAKLQPLYGTDADGSIASYTINSLPTLGTLQVDLTGTGIFTNVTVGQVLTPAQASRLRLIAGGTEGTTSFLYTTTDNIGAVDATPATYTIPITGSTEIQPPVAEDKLNTPMNANSGVTPTIPLSATDPDGGSIVSYTIINIPPPYTGILYYLNGAVLTAITEGGTSLTPAQALTIRFDPSGNYTGDVLFTYTATDNDDLVDQTPASYTIPIFNNPPDATNITNAAIASSAGPTTISPLAATDADGTVLTYTITALPSPGSGVLYLDGIAVLQGQVLTQDQAARIQFDPDPAFSGNAVFNFTATDNLGAVDQTPASFTIPVTNQPPVADDKLSQMIVNNNGTGPQNLPPLTGSDADGTLVTFTINTIPAGGILYFNGIPATAGLVIPTAQANLLTFDPNEGFSGTASFNYTTTDNNGNTDATPALYQIPVNTPPTTDDITVAPMFAGGVNTPLAALVGADDGSVQFYTITALPPASQGNLFLNGIVVTSLSQVDTLDATQITQLSFTPAATFTGTTFTYTATDNLGVVDVTPAVYTLPQKVSVSGNVWNDANGGLTQDGPEVLINGTNTGGGLTTGAVLYVNLIGDNGLVLDTAPVQADGSYYFPTVQTNALVSVQLTTVQGTVGLAKPATTLPAGWVTTGENKNTFGGFPDSNPDGEIIINTNNLIINLQNFGIERLPNTDNHATNIPQPDVGTVVVLNGGSNPPVLSGIDPEDCNAGCTLATRSVIIDAVPANSDLYYNSVLVTNSQQINNFDANLLEIRMTAATVGTISTSFQYSYVDLAGKKDPTPATYALNWSFPLPITLSSFTGIGNNCDAVLQWKTSQEINADKFVVEQSVNGLNFTAVAEVKSANSANGRSYQISVAQSNGIKQYRLKILDRDGSYKYSSIITVRTNCGSTDYVTVYPNPVSTNLTVSFQTAYKGQATLFIVNAAGQQVHSQNIQVASAANSVSLDMSNFAPGVYLLYLVNNAGAKIGTVQKVIKN